MRDGSTKHYLYYLCKTIRHEPKCQWIKSWERNILQDYLEESFLNSAGDIEITDKTYIPGIDRSSEIRELREAIDNLSGNLAYLKPGSAAALSILQKMEEHEQAIAELETIPVIPASWKEEGTGETYRDYWEKHPDWDARCELIRETGIRMFVGGSPQAPDIHMFYPEDLQRRINDSVAGTVGPGCLETAEQQTRTIMDERREREAKAWGGEFVRYPLENSQGEQ